MNSARPQHPRAPARLALVVVVAGLLGLLCAPAYAQAPAPDRPASVGHGSSGARARAQDDEALQVRLTSMSPATVPTSGPVRLSGTVRNTSDEDWRDVNVYPFTSSAPLTTAREIAQAADTSPDTYVGDRLGDDTFVAVGDLAPGDSTTFAITVPRRDLGIPDEQGVYWIGAHALGTDDDGRDSVADGRARTFIPLVRAHKPRTSLALVVPFRETVRRDAGDRGRLRDPDRWRRLLDDDGRLDRVLSFAESAGEAPITLLTDPAVLDAVDILGNGSRDPGAPSASASASPSAGASPSTGGSPNARPVGSAADIARARSWLVRFRAVASRERVLGLGYADPDVAALARRSPSLLRQASALSTDTFDGYRVDAAPTVAPANGVLPSTALPQLGNDTTVLLDGVQADPGGEAGDDPGSSPSLARTTSGQPLVLTDAAAAEGGPAPTPATYALAMRQRIAAEVAVRALDGDRGPLVVTLPASWDPGPDWAAANFFGGLDLPWLRMTTPEPTSIAPTVSTPAYPAAAAKAELGQDQVDAVEAVVRSASTYADALSEPEGVADQFDRLGLEGASYHARSDRSTSVAQTREITRSIDQRLSGIKVVGSSFVTMSSGKGGFVVTVVNNLARPVRVKLHARTSPDLRIPNSETLELPAKQRTTVKMQARSEATGVRVVELTPITTTGHQVGTALRFNLRNSQVSSLVWGVIAGALALLLITIVRRALKRGLHRQSTGL